MLGWHEASLHHHHQMAHLAALVQIGDLFYDSVGVAPYSDAYLIQLLPTLPRPPATLAPVHASAGFGRIIARWVYEPRMLDRLQIPHEGPAFLTGLLVCVTDIDQGQEAKFVRPWLEEATLVAALTIDLM